MRASDSNSEQITMELVRIQERIKQLKEKEDCYNQLRGKLPDLYVPDYNHALQQFCRSLPSKKRKIVKLYYGGKTLEEIGKTVGLSRERIRHIAPLILDDFPYAVIDRELRLYMKHLNSRKRRCKSAKKIEDILKEEKDAREKILNLPVRVMCLPTHAHYSLKQNNVNSIGEIIENNEKIFTFRHFGQGSYNKIKSKLKEYRLIDYFNSYNTRKIEEIIEKEGVDKAPIEALKLSQRPYNCLRRSRIFSVGDIIKNYSKLPYIRYLGPKSYDEIMSKLKKRQIKETK